MNCMEIGVGKKRNLPKGANKLCQSFKHLSDFDKNKKGDIKI